jgi:hypothetical protein
MKINKDELKESLTLEDVSSLVADLGGEPQIKENYFISRTICHNHAGQGSHKLYYYNNTHLFKCFTECQDIGGFDIYDLVRKQKSISEGVEWSLPQAIAYVAFYFGYSSQTFDFQDGEEQIKDWSYFKNYERINELKTDKQIIELKTYDDTFLKNLPHPIITSWEQEGITREAIKDAGIAYDPVNDGIVIPHYDINNHLIGVRERTLVKDREQWGKYLPAKINSTLYNHPLSFNLYNINNSKDNIRAMKRVMLFEGEKSCLLYRSYFGKENDISVSVCGSSLINYQVKLLMSIGVEEIIVCFDKQFKEKGDEEFKRWTKKLTKIHEKYSPFILISFVFDKKDLLDYKMSPVDKGKDIFLQLYKERIYL